MDDLILQARTAMTVYGPSIVQLASLIESEFLDQRDAIKFNRVPRWLANQKKVEAKKVKYEQMKAARKVSRKQPQSKDRTP